MSEILNQGRRQSGVSPHAGAHHARGWVGRNERTGREARIRSAARLRQEVGWGRLDQIRRLRERGLNFSAVRPLVDNNKLSAGDLLHNVREQIA